MRKLIGVVAAAAVSAASVGTAWAVPPPGGQVDLGGDDLRQTDASPDFAAADTEQRIAFENALKITDPAARAAAFEAFLIRYPTSNARRNALLLMVIAYAEAGLLDKLEATAARAQAAFPGDARVTSVCVDALRQAGAHAADAKAGRRLTHTAAADARRGLAALPGWKRTETMSPAFYAAAKVEAEAVFERAIGYAALEDKDYAEARAHLARAAALKGQDWPTLGELAAADLLGKPLDPDGFWYAARAMALARAEKNDAAADAIGRIATSAYLHYHGGGDGWAQIATAAATQSVLPSGFTVAPRFTPAELAVQATDGDKVARLSFSDWETVLSFRDASPENKAAAEKVWTAIQTLQRGGTIRLKLPAVVVAVTATTIDAAVGDDSRASGTADVHATLSRPLEAPPKPGDEIQLSGVLDGYTPQPFAFHMTQARVEPK
jgi:hypothetical protein